MEAAQYLRNREEIAKKVLDSLRQLLQHIYVNHITVDLQPLIAQAMKIGPINLDEVLIRPINLPTIVPDVNLEQITPVVCAVSPVTCHKKVKGKLT